MNLLYNKAGKMEHNHIVDKSLRIYGTCPACDLIYKRLMLESDSKDDYEIDLDTESHKRF